MQNEPLNYLVLQDLRATHVRRVRIMVLAISAFMIVFGGGMAVLFFVLNDWLVASFECALVAIGVAAVALARREQLRWASLMLMGSLLAIFTVWALFLDIPSPQVPRAVQHAFIPFAVAAYLMLEHEGKWLRHGVPLAGLAAAVFFSSSNFGIPNPYALPDSVRSVGNWVINTAAFGMLYVLLHIFMGDINRMESYLHNTNNRFVGMVSRMFPQAIAERLLSTGNTFAERHDNCSILFADIVGFTSVTERMAPEDMVNMLADIFLHFDQCVQRHGLTKIKTIGDAYMVAAGVPDRRQDHARALVHAAQEMMALVRDVKGIELRIGIASGELVAGVIGQSRQVYDVWGDVVNMASRMESLGVPGRIQVSETTYQLTRDWFKFDPCRDISIKGKDGTHRVYLLAEQQSA